LSRAESGARPQADFAMVGKDGADHSGGGFEDPHERVALGFCRDDHGILSLSATD